MDVLTRCVVVATVVGTAACGGTTRSDGSGGQAAGGAGGSSGSAGSGGVPGVSTTRTVDLLLVVDNSISMADKQAILAGTLPRLVQRLAGEFPPLADLHVGVISSSLGAHGGNACSDEAPGNDRGRLLPDVRDGLSHGGNGFLTWKAGDDVGQLVGDVAAHVAAAGEYGCGFEAPLESWYRFLADPNPPEYVIEKSGYTVGVGTDAAVLSRRAAFLRPDSLLAIVLLSDENDCSIQDADSGWYVSTITNPNGTPFPLAKPTSACATDPNSPCCRSCAEVAPPPAGCPNPDPVCSDLQSEATDKPNLRCWDQKRRFGMDFMYPIARYVNALGQKQLCPSNPDLSTANCEGPLLENPVFSDLTGTGQATRSSELVLLMSIIGAPWQDLATEASLGDPNVLEYLSATELAAQGRFEWITGDYAKPPADPLMIESEEPRGGVSPATGQALAVPGAPSGSNGANGHEWIPLLGGWGDLQYACIFPLAEPRDCDQVPGSGCDCTGVSGEVQAGEYGENNPLCQAPGSPAGQGYSSVQHHAKAYPGRRFTELARALGDRSVLSSICPKVLDAGSPAYGYNPAVDALVSAMHPRLAE